LTIPLRIREKLGLLPMTEVEFDIVGDSVRIRKKTGRGSHGRGARLLEAMRKAPRPTLSTDELMRLSRGE
jgi:bifunctional DNA-binding transcriptional regulator/antitoxin component of YhaV-PrlF toxin-antitoxin module